MLWCSCQAPRNSNAMKIKVTKLKLSVGLILLIHLSCTSTGVAQKLGDNLGTHKALKSLKMNNFDLSNVNNISAERVVVSSAAATANGYVALQVNGNDQSILIPRVNDLLNITAPSITAAQTVEGMIVYDLTTHKFYVRNQNSWQTFSNGKLANGKIYVGDAANQPQQVTLTGDMTMSNTGVTAIGALTIQSSMLADRSVTPGKIAPAVANRFLKTSATGTGASFVSSSYVDLTSRYNSIKGLKTFTSDSGFVAEGTFGNVIYPPTVNGPALYWNPGKAVFRAGSGSFNNTNLGVGSVAFGVAQATGLYAFSSGTGAARGVQSTKLGAGTATAQYAFSTGNSSATGENSTAFGGSTASGISSVSSGLAQATADYAIAMGSANVTASGPYSVALGDYATTNGKAGAFAIGGFNTPLTTNTVDNQYMSRFNAGYKFYTDAAATKGATLLSGASSWTTLSDKRVKEKFQKINSLQILKKIDTLNLNTWNYKGQDPKSHRHYGPMAQDFYTAFGSDNYGKIGNDTLINAADIDGIAMLAIKGLITATNMLKTKVSKLSIIQASLQTQYNNLLSAQKQAIDQLKAEIKRDYQLAQEYAAEVSISPYKNNKKRPHAK
jgi:hypothetical protein